MGMFAGTWSLSNKLSFPLSFLCIYPGEDHREDSVLLWNQLSSMLSDFSPAGKSGTEGNMLFSFILSCNLIGQGLVYFLPLVIDNDG